MSLVGREFKNLTIKLGPYICLTSISDELQKILLNVGNKIRKNKFLKQKNDYRKRLAGNLKEEYSYANAFTPNQRQKVNEELLWLASNYTKLASEFHNKKYVCEPDEIFLQEPIWINYMKQGEWNPLHAHAGDISCVIYLQVPKEIEDENKTTEESSKSNTPSAGRIEFNYGEDIGYSTNGAMYTPKEKDMIIFPAKLNHMVYPFKSKTERISVSVNFSDIRKAKLNLGMKP
jgi:uncharacterized protein (TIGR02466 family)